MKSLVTNNPVCEAIQN